MVTQWSPGPSPSVSASTEISVAACFRVGLAEAHLRAMTPMPPCANGVDDWGRPPRKHAATEISSRPRRIISSVGEGGHRSHRAEVCFGVGADVGEARRIGHARGLAGFGVGPALALLEFHGAIVEELVYWNRRKCERCLRGAAL